MRSIACLSIAAVLWILSGAPAGWAQGPCPETFAVPKVHPDPCFPCEVKTYGCPNAPYCYAQMDMVGLIRDVDEEIDFAVLGELDGGGLTTTPLATLGTDDLDNKFEIGGHLLLGYMFTPRFGLELGLLGMSDWDRDAGLRDRDGNLFSPFSDFGNPPSADFDFNNLAFIRDYSALNTAEINLRQRLEMAPVPLQTSILYGIRYLRIDERFDYLTSADDGRATFIDIEADNSMIGPQLGALFEFHVDPRWWVDVRMSAAICANNADRAILFERTEAGVTEAFAGAHGDDESTFVGDLSLAFLYYITPNLMTRIGYRALWVQGIATAADNFDTDLAVLEEGPLDVDTEEGAVYHGPFVGMGLEW
jgi:hypothetical protein